MKHIFIYETHLGGFFASDESLTAEECYCEQCGDYNWEIGNFDDFREFLKRYADNIDLNDGHGGYAIDYILENVMCYFDKDINREEAAEIVKANRVYEDDDE